MYYTEKEIMTQHEALRRTFEYFEGKKEEIKHFFHEKKRRKFLILGCGSSYMLAKSGQKLFCEYEDTAALAVAGGDYLLNPKVYQEYGKDSILVCLSRSGKTSEIVRSVQYAKEKYGCPVISITMDKENGLLPYSDLDLVMEWCYDQSVCQTRSVTNLYLAAVMLTAYYGNNTELITDVKRVLEKFVETFDYLYGDADETFLEDAGRRYFMLFLKPIINGVGNSYVEPETRNHERMDIVIDYRGEQSIIEMKVWRGNAYNERGEEQLSGYLDYFHLKKGYMLSFNFNKKKEIGVKEIVLGDKVLIEAVV